MEKQKLTQKEALEMLQQMNALCVSQNLIWYAGQGDLNKVELLLIGGLNPDTPWVDQQNKQFYALPEAIKVGNIKMIELLLAYGANINLLIGSDTPLIHAIENGQTDVAKFLIEKGADLNIMNSAKVNALYIAQRKKNNTIIELLKKAGAHEMTAEELKTHGKKKLTGRISLVIGVVVLIFFAKMCSDKYESSHSSGGSGSVNHTCTYCGKSYSHSGYYHIESSCEQYGKDPGFDAHCSNKCCSEDWNENGSGRYH